MKKFFLFFFVLFCMIISCNAVSLNHMQYVTIDNFPSGNSQYEVSFDINSNFWFVYRDSNTNNTTLVISSRLVDGYYTQDNATMPVIGDNSIYYTSRQNGFTYTYNYLYNSVSGTWDFQSRESYWDKKTVEYPASFLYQSSLVDFYSPTGDVLFPGPLAIWNLPLGMTMIRTEVPEIRGTMKTLALFGVGLIALLMVLRLCGKRFLLSLRR